MDRREDSIYDMGRMNEVDDLAIRMGDLLYKAGIRPFDRVRYRTAEEEVWFIWQEEKRIVIVELRDTSHDALRSAIEGASGLAGDPILN